jgi:hypothetical protein
MSKLSLIPLVLIVTLGAVWASTIIFPNTTEFPRTPQTAGTIWGVLYDWFNTDGTARNTDKLGGISASGYLQNHDCSGEPINKVWVGIDVDGRAKCGSQTPQLADIGTITEKWGTLTIWRNGSPISSPVWTIVREGDTIITDPTGTGTIAFIADESILRLDTSTTVELSIGNLSGQSVAQAILTDGRLWGRILTSTGVNLGGWGTVAWVRGTSVSISKSSTGYYTLAIVDSTNAISAASVVGWGATYTLSPGKQLQYAPSVQGDVAGWGGTMTQTQSTPVESTIGKSTLLTMSPWIRDNTRKDIDYLYANSGAGLNHRVVAEYNTTVPLAADTANLTALCSDTKIYWPSLIPILGDKCREPSLYAFANYSSTSTNGSTGPARPLIFRNNIVPASGNGYSITDWYMINNPGQYISYTLDDYSILRWKTITIEFATSLILSTSPSVIQGMLKLSNLNQIKHISSGWVCIWNWVTTTSCWDVGMSQDNKLMTIQIPNTISIDQFILCNAGPVMNFPIQWTIKLVSIAQSSH